MENVFHSVWMNVICQKEYVMAVVIENVVITMRTIVQNGVIQFHVELIKVAGEEFVRNLVQMNVDKMKDNVLLPGYILKFAEIIIMMAVRNGVKQLPVVMVKYAVMEDVHLNARMNANLVRKSVMVMVFASVVIMIQINVLIGVI